MHDAEPLLLSDILHNLSPYKEQSTGLLNTAGGVEDLAGVSAGTGCSSRRCTATWDMRVLVDSSRSCAFTCGSDASHAI